MGLVDSAMRNNFRAEQSQVVNDRLQQEMEKLRQLPYEELALTTTPTPLRRLEQPQLAGHGSHLQRQRERRSQLRGPGGQRRRRQRGNGDDQRRHRRSRPDPVSNRDVKGQAYRYVTWEQDPSCGNCADEWQKHLVVAVTLDQTASGRDTGLPGAPGERLQPRRRPRLTAPGPGPGGNDADAVDLLAHRYPLRRLVEARPRRRSPHPQRARRLPETAPRPGATAGAPDLMFPQPAPIDNDYPPDQQPTLRLRHRRRAGPEPRPGQGPAGEDPRQRHRRRTGVPDEHLQLNEPPDPGADAPALPPQVALARRSRAASAP